MPNSIFFFSVQVVYVMVDTLGGVMEPELNCSARCDSPLCFMEAGVSGQEGLDVLQRLCSLSRVTAARLISPPPWIWCTFSILVTGSWHRWPGVGDVGERVGSDGMGQNNLRTSARKRFQKAVYDERIIIISSTPLTSAQAFSFPVFFFLDWVYLGQTRLPTCVPGSPVVSTQTIFGAWQPPSYQEHPPSRPAALETFPKSPSSFTNRFFLFPKSCKTDQNLPGNKHITLIMHVTITDITDTFKWLSEMCYGLLTIVFEFRPSQIKLDRL